MIAYKIVGLEDDRITLYYKSGHLATFTLPVINGYFPEGEELTKLLDILLNDYVNNTKPVTIKNVESVRKLVVPKPQPMVTDKTARKQRDWLLFCTDWTQSPDSLSEPLRESWKLYRQQLRDLPNNQIWPDMDWPLPPKVIIGPMGTQLTESDGTPTLFT